MLTLSVVRVYWQRYKSLQAYTICSSVASIVYERYTGYKLARLNGFPIRRCASMQEVDDLMSRWKRQELVTKTNQPNARQLNKLIQRCENIYKISSIIFNSEVAQVDQINISTALLQMAKLGYSPSNTEACRVYRRIIILIEKQEEELQQQVISNMIWATAKCKMVSYNTSHQQFFRKLLIIALEIIEQFPQQGLNNIVWAMAKSGEINQVLFQRCLRLLSQKYSQEQIQPQTLSNVIWSIAKVRQHIQVTQFLPVLSTFCCLCKQQFQNFSTIQKGTIMWALKHIGYYDHDLMQISMHRCLVRARSEDNKDCFDSLFEMSNTMLAFAEFHLSSTDLNSAVLKKLQLQDQLVQQAVYNSIYALAVMGCDGNHLQPVLDHLFQQMEEEDAPSVQDVWLTQLFKAISVIQLQQGSKLVVKDSWMKVCRQKFEFYLAQQSSRQNELLSDVEICLKDLRIDWQSCQKNISQCGADIYIPSLRKYVKVLSPTSYTINEPLQLLGSVQATIDMFILGRRNVQEELVCVPFYDWSMRKDRKDKCQYLMQILQINEREDQHLQYI
eukprot:TRINITY_DN9204_c0_g3_i1.p1 TRINITY_DN9204_c0_g3~~TRINITY_DN9204_c0_g3_i1.p1  ORF type:complete len:569 (-),score=6.26 TRINITY_DN9204_c0_g3_i1:722-2392(-)